MCRNQQRDQEQQCFEMIFQVNFFQSSFQVLLVLGVKICFGPRMDTLLSNGGSNMESRESIGKEPIWHGGSALESNKSNISHTARQVHNCKQVKMARMSVANVYVSYKCTEKYSHGTGGEI